MEFLGKLLGKYAPNKKIRRKYGQQIKIANYYKTKSMLQSLLKDKYSDCYFMLPSNGLGDIFFVAGSIEQFKKENNGKVIFLLEKQSLIDFVKSFPSVDDVIYNKNFSYLLYLQNEIQQSITKEDVNILRYPYRGKKENYVFADNYINMLGLDHNVNFSQLVLAEKNFEAANKEYARLNISKNKTIILIPECVMFNYKQLKPEFWKNFAKKLEHLGYEVVFNSKNSAYKNFRTTFLPIVDFLAFAQMSKHIYSFRSGISDVFTGINIVHQTVIYPNNFEVLWTDKLSLDLNYHRYHVKLYDNEFDNLKHIYSLNSNFNRNDIFEIFYNGNEKHLEEELLVRIK